MKVQTITVAAGRTFNHPFEQYSNLRPSVTVVAQLEEGEDWQAATKSLQAQAEQLVEDHKRGMLKALRELNDLTEKQQELARLDRTLTTTQRRLEEIRSEHPQLALCTSLDEPALSTSLDEPDADLLEANREPGYRDDRRREGW